MKKIFLFDSEIPRNNRYVSTVLAVCIDRARDISTVLEVYFDRARDMFRIDAQLKPLSRLLFFGKTKQVSTSTREGDKTTIVFQPLSKGC